ncbi:MAG: tetratricopeptide repeat protein, partial [Myxococcales bacterium]|nr:tetratricopeptide repeat protein [Myxococcales bacterium]
RAASSESNVGNSRRAASSESNVGNSRRAASSESNVGNSRRAASSDSESNVVPPPVVGNSRRAASSESNGAPAYHRATAPVPTHLTKTIAVLPFRNGGASDEEYLADGLTDDLIDNLSMVHGLRVRSRGGVMALKGMDRDPRGLGRELGVQVVVEGTVRRAGAMLRVSTRLIGVADGFQLWARRFDRPAADVFSVGDEVSRAIAEALAVEPGGPPRESPTDPEALDLYLRARHEYFRQRREPVNRAIALFEQALARAPEDPTILAGYAIARVRLWYLGGPDARHSHELARAAAERAVAAGPHLGEPRLALASVLLHSQDPAGAARELQRAIAAAPGLAEAHDLLGRLMVDVGRIPEGARHLQIALALEPGLPQARWDLARAHALQGDQAKVDALLDTPGPAPVDERGLWFARIRNALWRRDFDRIEECARALSGVVGPGEAPMVTALLEIVRHRRLPEGPRPGKASDTELSNEGRRRRAAYLQLAAEGAAVIDALEPALATITLAVEAGLLDLAWLDRCPVLASVRPDPRFAVLRARVEARVAPVLAALAAPAGER